MERRKFLLGVAGVSAGVFAGCVSNPEAVLSFEEVNHRKIADEASKQAETIERNTDESGVVPRLFGNRTYTRTGRWEEIDTSLPVLYDGEYYRVKKTTESASPDVVCDIETEYIGEDTVEGETQYRELPEVDREAVSFLTSAELAEGSYNNTSEHLYEAGGDENSTIVSGTNVIVLDGRRFSVETEEAHVIEREKFSYTAEKIASSRDEFVSLVNDKYRFVLSDLSDKERAIVEEAIEDDYYENSPGEAFDTLVEKFQKHEPVEAEKEGGYWIVEYGGTTYWAELRY